MRDDLLEPKDVRKRLKVSRNKMYQMLRDGDIPAIRVGVEWRIDPEDFERWLKAGGTTQVKR